MNVSLETNFTFDLPYENPFLIGLNKVNVILGKNGCGKSTILRRIDTYFQENFTKGQAKYITPERGGSLTYDGIVETNISTNRLWLPSTRRNNRSDNFRQVSTGEFRRLETLVLRKIEKDQDVRNSAFTFDNIMDSINALLDNVQVERADEAGFQVRNNGEAAYRPDLANLSSGESELISLSIEILSYCYQIRRLPKDLGKNYLLLLDEPDVHLHPDLQERLIKLLHTAIKDTQLTVIIATHSTSILSSLSRLRDETVAVAFMTRKDENATFKPVSEIIRTILPIFGAHPLSNVFLEKPLLLVEGEDDERIWQQAVRSSKGRISVWPCAAGDIQSLNDHENAVEEIARAIYDHPIAYSLRDRDDDPYEIDDKPIVKRMRLNCKAAENLLLSDDVLADLGMDWSSMQTAIEQWIVNNKMHKQAREMQQFREGGYDRRNANIKPLCNLIMERAGSQKPWEVAVGQSISRLLYVGGRINEHGLRDYLGSKLVETLLS